jgi:hypothetical protein
MSNFLHQKLNEQPSTHLTIQSPNEEPMLLQGSSSPSFLNDQEQQILSANRQRKTSLDERIRSLLNNHPNEDKTNDIKDLPTATIRKSLPMPPGTSDSNLERKNISSKKRSNSFGGKKSTSNKLSSSVNNKRLSSTTASSSNRKSSSKKSRDNKVNLFSTYKKLSIGSV